MKARSSEAASGGSQAFAIDTGSIVGSGHESVKDNNYISFPSIPILSPLMVTQDHESEALLAWGNITEDYSLSSANAAQSNHLRVDARPTGSDNSHETRQAPGVESVTSANVGSLRLDTGGRSRYFGPTAASQWLRDVSHIWLV